MSIVNHGRKFLPFLFFQFVFDIDRSEECARSPTELIRYVSRKEWLSWAWASWATRWLPTWCAQGTRSRCTTARRPKRRSGCANAAVYLLRPRVKQRPTPILYFVASETTMTCAAWCWATMEPWRACGPEAPWWITPPPRPGWRVNSMPLPARRGCISWMHRFPGGRPEPKMANSRSCAAPAKRCSIALNR